MLEQILTISFFTAFFSAMVRMAVPLLYAGLGEVFAEKAGILNIGMEGVMLNGAFFAFVGAMFSRNLWVGLLCGIMGGVIVSMIHAFLSIHLAQNQSVIGLAINTFVLGITSFFAKIIKEGQSYQQLKTFSTIKIPVLSDIPLIGNALFNQDIFTYLLYILVILMAVFYAKTALGLSFEAIGEHPRAADAAGIPVHKYQYIAMLVNGILGGIGGAYLVLVQLGVFSENMTSGRGYIALAAVILGRYTPVGTAGAALIFGGANALQIRLQAVGVPLPAQALAMLPYIITLIALLGSIGRSNEPESLSKPYIRGSR
ncbi:ABC transporter permease [Frisingicoccus sp.]|uniref:ABC transporter permease n=1 Tax=Frisingicoccus sp. TaxID=1918627 RepID=UPI00260FFD08|nr:ABC transporter permease [Frisingicoccus sp.]MDD6232539.1 ABC transporter permease [Frisingicoccus sp.]MDY4834668.1 ABC transporter permease [Frisingicoccus sp.]MDY4922396.1 ABC transporter permease [Frisingicoccus sp.]